MRPPALLVLLSCLILTPHVFADEAAITGAIERFFATNDVAQRSALADQIRADPAYDRAKLGLWLHRARLFQPRPPGRGTLDVGMRDGTVRSVTLRIPAAYDPARPWPLLYVLHGAGGTGDAICGYFEQILGPDVEQYLIAAPTAYEEVAIGDARWPPLDEHVTILRAVRQTVHVDCDRVFLGGYSRGGHATWTLAVLHPDEFAGALPLAGTFSIVHRRDLWESFLPNVQHLPTLNVWGAGDTSDGRGGTSPDGGIAGLNRALRAAAERARVPLTAIELADRGHGDVTPPADALRELLARRRVHAPPLVQQTCRHVCQARAYWLEGYAWRGPAWTGERLNLRLRDGQHPTDDAIDAATVSAIRGRLGELRGEIRGQQIDVRRKNITVLTIWIGDGMVDWDQPVEVRVGGERVFEGRLEPDLLLCLTEAARTWDFDRLRWSGLRFESGRKTTVVTARTPIPDVFAEVRGKSSKEPSD